MNISWHKALSITLHEFAYHKASTYTVSVKQPLFYFFLLKTSFKSKLNMGALEICECVSKKSTLWVAPDTRSFCIEEMQRGAVDDGWTDVQHVQLSLPPYPTSPPCCLPVFCVLCQSWQCSCVILGCEAYRHYVNLITMPYVANLALKTVLSNRQIKRT